MGRYIGTGTAQANTCTITTATTCYQVNTHKYSYDANSCWQNRIIVDTPGSYSFVVPSGVCCLRVIAVGGGGKAKCTNGNCCGFAGAGGGYSEKWDPVASGCTISITVGRQEQDTTISYTNCNSVARTITGGGAAGCTPGGASGGDWNSTGGIAGYNCSYCGGSVSQWCGSCIYTYATTCCGYCVVWNGVSGRNIDPGSNNGCCSARAAGGGSAGSWIWSSGGAGQNAANSYDTLGDAWGNTAGGGGGIGYITRCPMRGSNCSCICGVQFGYSNGGQTKCRKATYPSGAGGGGGSKFQCYANYTDQSWNGYCQGGFWRGGPGGWGGRNNDEGRESVYWWFIGGGPNNHVFGHDQYVCGGPDPQCYPWHDIHEMAGSGSAGRNISFIGAWGNCQWVTSGAWEFGGGKINAGEGAGTGGLAYHCCSLDSTGWGCIRAGVDACGTVNWTLLCCLGTSGRICCADKMMDQLFPYIYGCAGTLGGAGGTTTCHLASKAGKGGGAGVTRSYIMCVCWGGTYDLCNGSGPALAFPPCALDWRVSTAGTGMAIIYWKDRA